MKSILLIKMFLGLVEMTFGLQLRHVDIYFLATKMICILSNLNMLASACPNGKL